MSRPRHIADSIDDRGAYHRFRAAKDAAAEDARSLSEWADRGHQALGERDHALVQTILEAELLPRLENIHPTGAELRRLREFGLLFDGKTLRQYCNGRAEGRFPTLNPGGSTAETGVQTPPLTEGQEQRLSRTYRSVYALLVARDRIDHDVTTVVPAWEYRHQVGERYYRATSAGSQEVHLIERGGEMKATLMTGGQGSGKSTALETLVEDRVERGHKVIDLLDFLKAENAMYDVPAQDDDLRGARAEMGLDVGFEEYDAPNLEIRTPLTPALVDSEVPYNTEREEWVVKPFVIPAAELTYRQLVMLLPHTTTARENELQGAYQELDAREDDWTLHDLAMAVREETNASETLADRIERSLKTAQNKTYIRDHQAPDDLILDWDDLMRDTDTITAFTVHPMAEKADKLLMASYLLDQLYHARQQLLQHSRLHEFPPLTTVMRELHKIVPRQKSEQDSEKTIEGYMIDTMSELIALVRHANMELLCDTQKFKRQLSDNVSGLFHRIFAFKGQKPDIEKVFRTRVSDTDPAERVAGFDIGECALVSGDGYTMPIRMAPPRCHHLDAKRDGNGLGFRVRQLEGEELREAPWDATVPARLRFTDLPESPILFFWDECLRPTNDEDDWVTKDAVAEAYNEWAEANGESKKNPKKVKSWISRNIGPKEDRPQRNGERVRVYAGYQWRSGWE